MGDIVVTAQKNMAATVSTPRSTHQSRGFVETNTIAVPPPLLVNGKVPVALVAAGLAIKDEKTSSYEIGLKTTLLNHRLRFNGAAFLIDHACGPLQILGLSCTVSSRVATS